MKDKQILRLPIIDYSELLILGLLLGASIYFEFQVSLLILSSLAWVAYMIYKTNQRLQDREPKIIISEKGINFCEDKILIEWKKIDYVFIDSKTEGSGKNANSIPYLKVEYGQRVISKRIYDYQFSYRKLERLIETYWGRKIGSKNEKLDSEAIESIKSSSPHEVIKCIKKYKTNLIISTLLILVTSLSFWIFLQVKFSFPYFIAIGVPFTFVVMFVYVQSQEKKFRNSIPMNSLTSEEFLSLLIKYQIKNEKSNLSIKGSIIGSGIFGVVIAIISYLINQ